jgi:hypothetical protein
MNVQSKKHIGAGFVLGLCIILGLSSTPVFGDDLNPPSYRGQPLSVHAHWNVDPTSGSGDLGLSQFSWVDDNDPSTYLHSTIVSNPVAKDPNNVYQFMLPNFVDELPLKLLRIQVAWTGTTQPPLGVSGYGLDIGQHIPGVVTVASTPLVFTQPDGGYQFFDMEFRPNPDMEWVYVTVPSDGHLDQVVIDTISVPEPAMLGLLALGGLALIRHRLRPTTSS